MKQNVTKSILGCVVASCLLTTTGQAIEGLTIQPQNGNIVLTWPSSSSATYIVQWRPTVGTDSTWQTLEANLPGNDGTTSYTDYNQVPLTAGMATIQSSSSVQRSTTLRADGGTVLRTPPPLPPSPWDIPAPNGDSGTSMTAMNSVPIPGDGNPGGSNDPIPAPTMRFYRVMEKGVQFLGLTNNITLSNVVVFPVAYANSEGQAIAFTLNEDSGDENGGGATSLSDVVTPPSSGLPEFILDTTMMSNGLHTIYASALWDMGATDEGGPAPVELTSAPMTINVYNEISFPNWMPTYGELGDSLLISAQSAHASADYWIDVYAYYDDYYYVGTFGGHTDDGNIQSTWNLIGPSGESYADASSCAFVISTEFSASAGSQGVRAAATSGSSSAATPKTYRQTDPWTGPGGWAVANQQAWTDYNGSEELDIVADGFVKGAIIAQLPVLPTPDSDEHAYRIQYGDDASSVIKASQWSTFRSAIYNPQSRNLFYLGHGDITGIGANSANTNVFIPATEIASMLHTLPVGQTNRHGYRFVFLDGCATAKGTLCESFGIIHKENVPFNDYMNSATRPSAFVGWDTEKWIGIQGNSVLSDHWNFVQYFQIQWALNNGVKQAILNAKSQPNVPMIHADTLKVFGYWGLHINAFNR